MDLVLDAAGNKGTGSWSSKAAFDLGVPSTMMSTAVFARYLSSFKEKRIDFSKRTTKKKQGKPAIDMDALKNTYRFARLINHSQGFDLMERASEVYNWNLNLAEIARIWTQGCIIKSKLMVKSIDIFRKNSELLSDQNCFQVVSTCEEDIVTILKFALDNRISTSCFHASYDYWVMITTENLPANLIQAQRDYFGAHTYQRIDAPKEQFFHTNWASS